MDGIFDNKQRPGHDQTLQLLDKIDESKNQLDKYYPKRFCGKNRK